MRLLLSLFAAMLLLATPASGAAPNFLLGVRGNVARFQVQTGQTSQIHHSLIGWNQGVTWASPLPRLLALHAPVPLIGLTTDTHGVRREAITPAGIASGAGDAYLVAWNRATADWGKLLYVRPMPEMNGWWNFFSAYNRDGTPRNAAHSTASFRKAFARIYLILHGGPLATVNARLHGLGLPPVRAGSDLPANSASLLRVVWNPQGFGSPDVPGNRAQAYYPGDAYVDVVGNDLYDVGQHPAWAANERLYRAHRSKPYGFPEWGLWGADDPAFVRAMARFARTHSRLELLVYNSGQPGSLYDLASRPRSRAAYRAAITPLGQ